MDFWNINIEKNFFKEVINNFASPEQLFYKLNNEYFAYVPKKQESQGHTLQSRNSLIGHFSEKWCKKFLQPIADNLGLFAVNNVVCPSLGLSKQSNADLAFCSTNDNIQSPENIKIIF